MEIETIRDYILSLYGDDKEINFAQQRIIDHGMRPISIAPIHGRLLTILGKMMNAEKILELGCLGGVGSIYLSRGLTEGGKVISLEFDEKHVQVAEETLRKCHLEEKIEVRQGDALTSMAELESEHYQFDLIFIDADKETYPEYLEQAIKLSKSGTIIVGDNTLSHGQVIDKADKSPKVEAIRKFNKMMVTDERLESTLLPGVDGFTIARVK